jgi:hypothetical protein
MDQGVNHEEVCSNYDICSGALYFSDAELFIVG